MYALAADEATIRAGTKKPEPLVIRANEGDCIEVTLTNKLTDAFLNHAGAADGNPKLPLEPPTGTPAGLRVSLHPQLVQYEVRYSDGATVGFNRDQTVGKDEKIVYHWYADDISPGEIGATNLLEYGDVRGHRHHGLSAGLNIEPKGATYHDPVTGNEIGSGTSADIRLPGSKDFREFTVNFMDGLNLRERPAAGGQIGAIIPDLTGEAEDQGEKGFSYTSEPFSQRGVPVNGPTHATTHASVFSSLRNGDPDTPIFRSYVGDDVRMRVLQGSDKPRQHAFTTADQAWKGAAHGDRLALGGHPRRADGRWREEPTPPAVRARR